jgi:hypothetical protein
MTTPAATAVRRSEPEAFAPADVLFDGELTSPVEITDDNEDEAWRYSIPLFIGGANVVDLFIELRAPALMTPRFCYWYAEFSPTRRAGDWYRETAQRTRPDGTIEERAALHEITELEPDQVAEVIDEKDLPPTLVRRHVRIPVRARYVRLGLRSRGSHVRITAIAGT